MALWDKLRTELDRAGKVAADALDDGKVRLEIFRARQLTDKAAQALGYAVHRERTGLAPAEDGALTRLVDAVSERERAVAELESRLHKTAGAGTSESAAEPGRDL